LVDLLLIDMSLLVR